MSVLSGHQFLPPMGYYNQPHPESPRPEGAKAPEEHLAALEDKRSHVTGKATATLGVTSMGSHHLKLHHEGDGTSHLVWRSHERTEDYRAGEIITVDSEQKGDAKALHDTARAIATDNPSIAFPKHSPVRTDEGDVWVRKEQRRHGEQEWGVPPTGTPEHAQWSRLTDRSFDRMVGLAA
jgi:hypothetical protein